MVGRMVQPQRFGIGPSRCLVTDLPYPFFVNFAASVITGSNARKEVLVGSLLQGHDANERCGHELLFAAGCVIT
jgi:hypothetical protein